MGPKIWFAPAVIEDLSRYRGGREEQYRIETLLENNPVIGREYIEGIPAIRAVDKLFGDPLIPWPHVGTLTWYYLTTPFADSILGAEDEIVVFRFGKACVKKQVKQDEVESGEILMAIRDIFNTAKLIG